MLTFNVSSATAWMDPLSHAISFNVHNTGGAPLEFVSSNPALLWRRMECRCAGILVDDITDYNRLANLMTVYQSTGKRLQAATPGLWDQGEHV